MGAALSRSMCHLPQPTVPVTKREQRDGERKMHCHVRKPTDHFTAVLHFILAAVTALTDLAAAPVVNYTTVILV